MSTSTPVIAPFYNDDEVEDLSMVNSAIAASNLPQSVITYAQQAEAQEGEAVVGVLVVDASGSMEEVRQATVDGLQLFREALMKSHERRKMHIRVILFNNKSAPWEPHGPGSPFLTLLDGDDAFMPEITLSFFRPNGLTALYAAVQEGVAAVDLLARALKEEGYDVRRVVAVVSDGFDNRSPAAVLAQLRAFVQRCVLQEGWAFLFFGLISETLLRLVADEMGMTVPTDPAEREAFSERIFRCIACKSDAEIEKAILRIDRESVLGGMGFPDSMVMAFPQDPENVRDAIGVKLSSTFVKASSGGITTGASLKSQVPDPNAVPPSSPGSFV